MQILIDYEIFTFRDALQILYDTFFIAEAYSVTENLVTRLNKNNKLLKKYHEYIKK